MRCTVVHCTLTACLQGEFWRNGTKVLCSCSIAHALRRNHVRDPFWSILHFDIFHVRDFIPTTQSWNPLCEVSSSSAPIHCKGFAIIPSSQQIQHIGERDDSVPLTIHTTERWHVNDVCLYKPTSRQSERARDRDLGWKHADVCLEKQKSTGCPRFWGSCH